MVSIVAASLIVLVITVLGPLLEPVPKACLGNIVVVALSPTILRITEVADLWKISKLEAVSVLGKIHYLFKVCSCFMHHVIRPVRQFR